MQYIGNKKQKAHTALIGKGITFDSGGINLKSSKHIKYMRCDMAGAAAVMGIMQAAAETKLPLNITGVIAAAHNAIGSNSYYPGDVYKSYGGKTVEVANTDAEGRLVLADAISYIVKNYKPETIIDLATLTGSISLTFAHFVAGVFANNDTLAKELFTAGEKTQERVWQLPLYSAYKNSLKGEIGDLSNLSNLEGAGAITGAAFLEAFVEKTRWAHIDIGGTAFLTKACGYLPKFGTGFGVRLIMEWLSMR